MLEYAGETYKVICPCGASVGFTNPMIVNHFLKSVPGATAYVHEAGSFRPFTRDEIYKLVA